MECSARDVQCAVRNAGGLFVVDAHPESIGEAQHTRRRLPLHALHMGGLAACQTQTQDVGVAGHVAHTAVVLGAPKAAATRQ